MDEGNIAFVILGNDTHGPHYSAICIASGEQDKITWFAEFYRDIYACISKLIGYSRNRDIKVTEHIADESAAIESFFSVHSSPQVRDTQL